MKYQYFCFYDYYYYYCYCHYYNFLFFSFLGTSNGVPGSLDNRVGGSCRGSDEHFPLKLAVHICTDDNCPVCDSLECYTKGSVSFPSLYRCLLTWKANILSILSLKIKIKLDVKSLESMLDVALLSDDCKTSIGQKNALHKKSSFSLRTSSVNVTKSVRYL